MAAKSGKKVHLPECWAGNSTQIQIMTNSLSLKKAFTVAVAAATILATAGLSAFAPTEASAAEYGDIIKGETLSTVYYYGSDGMRYSFPDEKTYFSWYENFDSVVEISDEELADITLAGNIVRRPGSRWIKITSDENVYVVTPGGEIRWVEDEDTAEGLAGSDWNTFIDDVPDVFFVDYTVGDSLTSAEMGYDGMLWSDGSDMYLVWDGEARMVSEDGADANMFQDGFWLSGEGFDVDSLDMGDDIDGEMAYLTDAAQMVEGEEYAETQEITVSLSSDSPSASTLIAGQGIAHIASYEFENSTSDDVVVTSVSVDRTGVSSDTTLSNVYLFDGWLRLTDSATVSSGTVTWNDTTGLFTIPAGESATIAVRSDIASSTSGQTLGVELNAADTGFDGAYEASGSSLDSAEHTIASTPSNFGTVSFASTTTPSSDGAPEPQEDFRTWENVVTVGNNESMLYGFRVRNIGSVDSDDVENWRLYVAGTEYGDAVDMQDDEGYVGWDLSADPVELNTGNHTFKVLADIVGGSTRTVSVSLRNTADAIFVEGDYDQPVLVQANSYTFSSRSASAQTVASGDVTFTKETDSPSGDVTDNSSAVTLGSWEVRATGEAMKIESLNFNVIENASETAYTLRNGAVYVDGSQVGSTTALCGNDTTTSGACTGVAGSGASYTAYTFGSSFVVYPGSPVTMEIRADIYDNDGSNAISNGDTIQANIDADALSSNVLRMTSGGYITRPASDVTANTMTVAQGTFTVAENTSYADQTVVVPKTDYKVGSWTITAGTTEDVDLTQLDVNFDTDEDGGVAVATDDYTNLYIMYGPADDMVTSSIKSSVTTNNSWSVDYALEAGETIYLEAYADVAAAASDGTDGADFITANVDISGTAPASGTSISSTDTNAQTITYHNAGSFNSYNASHPSAMVVAGNQEVTVANYRFAATNEDYTIKELTTSITAASVSTAISQVHLYDGSDLIASTVYDENTNTRGTFTGLSIDVDANTSKTLTVAYTLNEIGSSAGTSQVDADNTLYSVKRADSNGTETTDTPSGISGNSVFVYKSIPTVAHVDLTNSTLINGQATDLYKFTITASSAGDIAIKQLKFPVTWTDADADTLEMESFKLYRNGTDVSSTDSGLDIQDNSGNDIEGGDATINGLTFGETDTTIVVIFDDTEETISAGETVTYTLRATPYGFDIDGTTGEEDYFTLYLAGDTGGHNGTDVCLADTGSGDIWELDGVDGTTGDCDDDDESNTAYNFIWSDISGSNHNGGNAEDGSADWANGYLILSLDLDAETWFK